MKETPRLPLAATLLMTLVTGVYLSFEIPFGALLLDVVSNGSDADTISRLEQAGRLIAGAALALAMLPFVIKQATRGDKPLGRVLLRSAIFSIAIIGIAFVAQRVLVDSIADRSSPTERKAATQALAIRNAFPADLSRDPAGRAVAALSPLAAFARPTALTESGGLTALATEQARRAIGDAGSLRSGAYAEGLEKAREFYAAYRASQSALASAAGQARQASAEGWQDWYKWLDSHTWGMAMREGIRSSEDRANYARIVRERGVPVPQGWYPLDEAGFRAAAERAFLDRATKQAVGSGLPVGIASFDDFLRDPAVQAKMRGTLGPIAASFSAGENADDAAFRNRAWMPAIEAARDGIVADATADVSDFADGRSRAILGKSAVRAIAVPPIALLLSLLGLSVHLFKFANYASILLATLGRASATLSLLGRPAIRFAAIALLIAAGTAALRDPSAPAVTSAFWEQSEPAIAAQFGGAASAAATFVIQMQPGTYPVSARIAAMPHFAGFAAWVHGAPAVAPAHTVIASR
jgi:hypothetical protein